MYISLTKPAPSGKCTGLNPEWTNTLEITTQFPVDPGSVVEVNCINSGHVITGSSQITCIYNTEFSYDKEPNCGISGIFLNRMSYLTLVNFITRGTNQWNY